LAGAWAGGPAWTASPRPGCALAREEGTASGVASPLTQRQLDVLGLVSSGLSNKEAAQRLNLSARTVEMHVARILERLNCRTRSEAIRKAVDSGWI
jgi:DNA-binding NarL/FixJ family response regulator